ncbi:MAG: hypothetical protein R2744_05930 [Bacteroidales bacterium]
MKKIKSYFVLFIVAAVLSSCSGLNKMKKNAGLVNYDVVPEVLETHAGMVEVTVKGTFLISTSIRTPYLKLLQF